MTQNEELSEIAPSRKAKLLITAGTLVALGVLEILALIRLQAYPGDSPDVVGITIFKPWLLAAIGGMLGGTSRAIWAFLVEVRSFEIYHRTGKRPIKLARLFGEPVEYWFDFMWVWYLYLLKPFMGGLLGFLTALLLQFGLIPFLVQDECDTCQSYAIVIVAALAGFFAEDAIDFLGRLSTVKTESAMTRGPTPTRRPNHSPDCVKSLVNH